MLEKTRIVINGRFLTQDITGVQRVSREIVKSIDLLLEEGLNAEFSVELAVPSSAGELETYKNVKIVGHGSLSGHLWEQLELPHAAAGDWLLCLGNVAPISSLYSSRRVAVLVHDLSFKYFPSAYSLKFRAFYSFIVATVLKRADLIFTVSNAERNAILDVNKDIRDLRERLVVAPNGGLPDQILGTISDGLDDEKEYVLYVGSLSRRKNAEGVFEVASRLSRERGIRTIIVGGSGGVFRTLRNSNLAQDKRIEVIGQINSIDNLVELYRGAILLFFPSFYESSGLPPMEAMGAGCPVVVSNIDALQERCGGAAEYCDPYDLNSMMHTVTSLIDDADKRKRLIALGRKRSRLFTWRTQALSMLSCIRSSGTRIRAHTSP